MPNHKSKPQKAATKAKDNSTPRTRFTTLFPALALSRYNTYIYNRCPNILHSLSFFAQIVNLEILQTTSLFIHCKSSVQIQMFKTKITLGINIAFAFQLIKQRLNVTRAMTANTNMKNANVSSFSTEYSHSESSDDS